MSNQTPPPALERLRALSAKWRAEYYQPYASGCGDKRLLACADDLDAVLASLLSEQPNDATGQGRLLLNAYGRTCYEAGEANERAKAASLPSGWQPIASCPKDGTAFLVWIPRRIHMETGFVDVGDFGDEGVQTRCGDLRYDHPTHWMPLPPAPAPDGGSTHGK